MKGKWLKELHSCKQMIPLGYKNNGIEKQCTYIWYTKNKYIFLVKRIKCCVDKCFLIETVVFWKQLVRSRWEALVSSGRPTCTLGWSGLAGCLLRLWASNHMQVPAIKTPCFGQKGSWLWKSFVWFSKGLKCGSLLPFSSFSWPAFENFCFSM